MTGDAHRRLGPGLGDQAAQAENETALLAPLEAGEKVSAQSPIFPALSSGERTLTTTCTPAACCSASMPHRQTEVAHSVLEGVAFGMAQASRRCVMPARR